MGDLEQIFAPLLLQPGSNTRVKRTQGENRDMAQARLYVYMYNALWKPAPSLQTLKLFSLGNITGNVAVARSRYLREERNAIISEP